ncbi:MAG: ROK family protein [Clostridia bacterium]|nr:ROK family protein [Clostridia bacterium]
MVSVGVDVGGTFIKCAAVDDEGKILFSTKAPTPDGQMVAQVCADLAEECLKGAGIDARDARSVGIGTTGHCDTKMGVLLDCKNIKNYNNIKMCEYVSHRTGLDAYIDNDANCAALGEYMMQGGEKKDNFIFVTLGTGVGGGIIIDGKLLRGVNGAAGEIGHMVLFPDGEMCNCGRRGCWERYASTSALVRQSAGLSANPTGRTAFDLAEKGDRKAREVLDKWIYYVSLGVCDLVNIFQPDVIVIGGGVSREGEKIVEPVRKFVAENSMTGKTAGVMQTEIKTSKLFNDAGVIGASFLYTQGR